MSISQKYNGLILVPWFNSNEWKFVYNSVYSKNKEEQLKALELLKLWKIRTPILSAGIEGTLILLEVLLIDSYNNLLSEEQISNLFSIALMRFLNLSAANSDKQGSFTKTSTKNELPKWLINLRHDIAHGHQIPSIYKLKLALEFGLNWLKEKYWIPQLELVEDYFIDQNSEEGQNSTDIGLVINAYVELNASFYEKENLDTENIRNIKAMIKKKFKNLLNNKPSLMFEVFLETISQYLSNRPKLDAEDVNLLISPYGMLKYPLETLKQNGKRFKDIWSNLLNIFHQHGFLIFLIRELFNVTCDIRFNDELKEIAASWINELFLSLINLRTNEDHENTIISLRSCIYDYKTETYEFLNQVLNNSNTFTQFFIESLHNYNECKEEMVQNLIKCKTDFSNLHNGDLKIYSIKDLAIQTDNEDLLKNLNSEAMDMDVISVSLNICSSIKWEKLQDTSMFKNCPIGILPHQIGLKHPFLIIN